jgi:hypothetical protein
MYGYFMQNSATVHTANFSMTALEEVFGDQLITHGFWPSRAPDLNPCNFYLRGTLEDTL